MNAIDIDKVRELSAVLAAADAALLDNEKHIAELRARADTLDQRHRALSSQPPVATRDFEDAMAARFAADATASLAAEELAQAAERRAAAKLARDDWETNVDLLDQARGRVAIAIRQAKGDREVLKRTRDREWRVFVRAAHNHLLAAFRERFLELHAEYLEPMAAMRIATDADGRDIITRTDRRISDDSTMEIGAYNGATAASYGRDTLFSLDETNNRVAAARYRERIDAYRQTLGG